ncbi:MAG: hypothetical protein HQK49_04775 [Oligoflexia bacterium]|nr:hypothetical protein [Oligoflexia bacterium]
MEFNTIIKDIAKFTGKTFRDMEEIFNDLIGRSNSDDESSRSNTVAGTDLKLRIVDDLSRLYSELGERAFVHLQKNNIYDDEELKSMVAKVEKLKKNLQDIIDIENDLNSKASTAATESINTASTTMEANNDERGQRERERETYYNQEKEKSSHQ